MELRAPPCFVRLQARPFFLEKPIRSPPGDHLTSRLPPGGASAGAGPAVASSRTRPRAVRGSPGRRRAARPRPAPAAPRPRGFPGARRPAVSARHAPLLAGRVRSRAPRRLRDRGGGRRQSSRPRAMSSPAVARSSPGGSQEVDSRPQRQGRFWEVGGGGGGDRLERAAAESERWELLLRRGELLALGGHLKGALEAYAAALRRGAPVRPECLGTLVDCLVFNYRLRHGLGWSASPAGGAHRGVSAGGLLSCLGCRGFLSEPVTVPCGHSYCRRCLRRELRARCRLCRDRLPPAAAPDAPGTSPRPPRPPPSPPPASGPASFSTTWPKSGSRASGSEPGRPAGSGSCSTRGATGRPWPPPARSCEQVSARAPRPHPSFPEARGGPKLVCAPGRLPPRACVLGSRDVCVLGGVCVGRGGAPRCFGHNGDRPGADCDAARGFLRLGLALWRARPEWSGAERVAGRGRASAGWGGSWASLSVGSLPAALFPVIGRPGRVRRGETPCRGGEEDPQPRLGVQRIYLGLPQKSPGQLEAAGGRIA